MIIRVDEEGRRAVLTLVDAAIRAGAFQGMAHISQITSAIQLIDPKKDEDKGDS